MRQLVAALEEDASGLRDRLRLATFDDYLWNRAVYGGVTTAAQDTEAIAQAVLDRVVDRLSANVAVDGAAAPLRRETTSSTCVAMASFSSCIDTMPISLPSASTALKPAAWLMSVVLIIVK